MGNHDRLPEYVSDFRRLSPEVVQDMFAMHEQHARDLMTTFTGIAKRVVVASRVEVYPPLRRAPTALDEPRRPAL